MNRGNLMQLSAHAARNEFEESTTALVVLSVIGLAKLLRVGGSVAWSTIDSHGCDGLHTGLGWNGDVRSIVSVSVGTGDIGERVAAALCGLTTRVGVWTWSGSIDDGLIGRVRKSRGALRLSGFSEWSAKEVDQTATAASW
jgi:hypothetical protein